MAEIGPNLQQGGYFNGPAPQSGRYDTQVNPEGADRPTINPHSIHIDSSVGDALSGVGREGAAIAERQLAAEQRLWLTQQTAADDLAAQKMEIDARNSVEPGGTTFKGVNEGWQQYTQSRLESIKDPILKSVYASSLTQAGKSLMGSAQTFDAQEQQRQAGVNFQQAVENKSKFYDNLNPSLVDARLQNDLGELGSVIDKTAATPEERQKMRDYMMKMIPDAANERKISSDPQAYLTQQAPARSDAIRVNDMNLPRGVRNNNPGNLTGGDSWQGKTGADAGGYLQFDTPENGLRAMAVDLKNQQQMHGLNTVQDIISKYAPPDQNNTPAYVASVANDMGVKPDQQINLNDPQTLGTMMQAMIHHENGTQPYSQKSIAWAATSAAQPDVSGPSPPARADGGINTGSVAWNMGTYEQQRSWMEKAESKVKEVAAERAKAFTQGNELIKTVQDRMDQGLTVPPDEFSSINQFVVGSGAPELINKWNAVQDQNQAMQGYMKMTPMALRDHIDQTLMPAVEKGGATQQEFNRLQIAQKTLSTMDQELQNDPLGWYQKAGGAVPQLNFNSPADMQQRRAIARTVAQTYNVPLEKAIFTPQEATQFSNVVKAATPDVQVKAAMSFAQAFGDDTDNAAMIFRKDVPLFGYAASMIASNPATIKTANDMLVGSKLLETDKGAGVPKNSSDTEAQNWQPYFVNPIQLATVRQAAEAVYAARNYGKPFDSGEFSKAMSEVAGGERAKVGGNLVLAPPGVNGDAFEAWTKTLTSDRLKELTGGTLPVYKTSVFDPKTDPLKLRMVAPGAYYIEGGDGKPLAGKGHDGIAIINVHASDITKDMKAGK